METRVTVVEVDETLYYLVETPAHEDDASKLQRAGYLLGLDSRTEGEVEMIRVLVSLKNLPIVADALGLDWKELATRKLREREEQVIQDFRAKYQEYRKVRDECIAKKRGRSSGNFLGVKYDAVRRAMAEHDRVIDAIIAVKKHGRS